MRGYIIFSVWLLSLVSFMLLRTDDLGFLGLEAYVQGRIFELYERVRGLNKKIFPQTQYQALTWVDFEHKLYFDKETIDTLLEKRFYGHAQIDPGTYNLLVTGYSSTLAQCGANPFITASGQRVRSGIVATNFLPLGARIKIPQVFGDQVFEVQDRMAQRHWARVDIWFPTYQQAVQFGVRRLEVEVF